MPNIFFPYQYYDEALTIEITELKIDNEIKNTLIDEDLKCINLEMIQDWETLDCRIMVKVPDTLSGKFSIDSSNDDWNAILLIKSMAGSGRQIGWRRKIQLISSDESKLHWKGNFRLSKIEEGSWVQIQTFLTRAKNVETAISNQALLQGQRLASSQPWSINIDERTSPLGKSIRIEWINFLEDPRFEDYPTNVFYIDLSESLPVLFLNEAIEDLKVVLNSKGYTGLRAAVRESIFRSVAQPVWLSLVLAAINDKFDDEDDRPEWERSVIRQFAPLVIPEATDEDSAVKLFIEMGNSPNIFLPRLTSAIQSSIDIDRSTTRLLNSIIQN